jgi:hypothetical protein
MSVQNNNMVSKHEPKDDQKLRTKQIKKLQSLSSNINVFNQTDGFVKLRGNTLVRQGNVKIMNQSKISNKNLLKT